MENAFVELAQGCSDAALFEKEVLAAFSETIGFDVAYFSVKGLETEPTVSGLPRETIQRAVAGAGTYARELMPVKRAALAARGVAVDTDVLGVSRVRNAHYYNDVAMTVGGGHALMAYVPFRGSVVAAVMLGRTTKSFSRAEVSAVEHALPSLGVARGVREVVQGAKAEFDDVRLVPVVSIGETFSPDAPRNVVVIGTRGA